MSSIPESPLFRTFASNNDFSPEGETVENALEDARSEMSTFCRGFLCLRADLPREEALKTVENFRWLVASSFQNEGPRPKVVCLVGSSRFFVEFQRAAYLGELAGEIIIGPGFTPDVAADKHGGNVGITPEQKIAVDVLYRHKIAMSDEVRVINVGGYVGESTKGDLVFARSLGKKISWLEPERAIDLSIPEATTSP